MVQIVNKKKKGRPVKTDLSRRRDSVSDSPERKLRRSGRRRNVRYIFDFDDYIDEEFDYFDDDDDEDKERRDKKLRLLLKLENCSSKSPETRRASDAPTASTSSSDYGKPSKKRKIDGDDEIEDDDGDNNEVVDDYYDNNDEVKYQKGEATPADSVPGTPLDHSSVFTVPDKKTLELILDKLQKKDIYGVYAEPVDPDELPDYHEVIKNPMDFATVRKKLSNGKYLTLEQFENDVFLICENAMQYNAPDTVYYKQAFSIQELAKRKFQRLKVVADRSEKEIKTEEKTTTNSCATKQIKKPISRRLQEPVGSDFSSGATLAMAGDVPNGSNIAQAIVFEKPSGVDKIIEGNLSSADNIIDNGEEPASGKSLLSRSVRKASVQDENRRATYNMSTPSVIASESVFTTFEGESKQLVPVGLQADHSYSWSLARFAANLGSVAWKVASRRIEQALPPGVKYGRGWIGEYEPLQTPVLMLEKSTLKEPTVPIMFPHTSDKRKEDQALKAPRSSKENHSAGSNLVERPFSGPAEARSIISSSSAVRVSVKEEPVRVTSLNGKSSFASPARTGPTDQSAIYQQENLQSRNLVEPEKNAPNHAGLRCPPFANHRSANTLVERKIPKLPEVTDLRLLETASPNRGFLQSQSSKQVNVSRVVGGGIWNGQVGSSFVDSRITESPSDGPKQKVGTTYFSQGQEQGLTDPVHLMRMLAEKDQHSSLHQSPTGVRPIGSPSPSLKNEDSGNAAEAAARAWMSIGAGGFKPATENTISCNGKLTADPLNNATRDHQPPLSRFRGEFPTTAVQFQRDRSTFPMHTFVPQPVRMGNETQFPQQPMVFPQLVKPDLSRFQLQSPWRGLNIQSQPRQKQESLPPDLNIGYQSSGSPARQSSGILVDTQQPDLALQL